LPAHFSSVETAPAADRPPKKDRRLIERALFLEIHAPSGGLILFFFNSLPTHRMVLTSHDGTAMIGTP
jgi:hypothetical protein